MNKILSYYLNYTDIYRFKLIADNLFQSFETKFVPGKVIVALDWMWGKECRSMETLHGHASRLCAHLGLAQISLTLGPAIFIHNEYLG